MPLSHTPSPRPPSTPARPQPRMPRPPQRPRRPGLRNPLPPWSTSQGTVRIIAGLGAACAAFVALVHRAKSTPAATPAPLNDPLVPVPRRPPGAHVARAPVAPVHGSAVADVNRSPGVLSAAPNRRPEQFGRLSVHQRCPLALLKCWPAPVGSNVGCVPEGGGCAEAHQPTQGPLR